MKAIMYHYVRPEPDGLPHFRYLHIDDFAQQLDVFCRESDVLTANEFLDHLETGKCPERAIALTFDDGLAEHLDHAAPILESRGLTGLFFMPTGPMDNGKPLDVHRVHHLLGEFGGVKVLEALQTLDVDNALMPGRKPTFEATTYQRQINDTATTEVKRFFNYYIAEDARDALLTRLEDLMGADRSWTTRFYLSKSGIAELRRRGHIVASHGVSHRVMSSLSETCQKAELKRSFDELDMAHLPEREWLFCYPYGGPATYDDITKRCLLACRYRFAFAVDPRPIGPDDIRVQFALPRFDCNQFPFGQASCGRQRPNADTPC